VEKPLDQPLRIACLGECMIELSGIAPAAPHVQMGVAGDTLNTAVYLARQLPRATASISYLTALGPDALSDRMLSFMAAEKIDTSHIARLPDRLPGIYAIELDESGERSFRYWRSEAAARSMLRPGAIQLETLARFDAIYVSGISLAILPPANRQALLACLADLRSAGRTILFDSNYRPKLWDSEAEARAATEAAWRVSTIGLPSFDDEVALFGTASAAQVIDRIAQWGVPEIALKRGADGPLLFADGRLIEGEFAPAAIVVDTTAAGDSFNAGYVAARLTGHTPSEAAAAGHRLACHVIGHKGAIVDLDA